MGQGLELLELEEDVCQILLRSGIDTIPRLRDSTLTRLDACGLTDHQSRQALACLDAYLMKRFDFQVLFPMLPEPCQFVECGFLTIPTELLVSLELHRFQYLYELAMSRYYRLNQQLGPDAVSTLEAALKVFVESYREGEIVLHVEEKNHDYPPLGTPIQAG